MDLLNSGQKSPLLESYLIEALEAVYERHTYKPVDHQRFSKLIEPLVADALSQYRMTRTAPAQATGSPAAGHHTQHTKQLSPERPACGADSGHVRHDQIGVTGVTGVSA